MKNYKVTFDRCAPYSDHFYSYVTTVQARTLKSAEKKAEKIGANAYGVMLLRSVEEITE